MISTERMRKLEVLVLARDIDAVLRFLGFAGCLQLIAEPSQPRELTPDERGIVDLDVKVASLCRFLGVDATPPAGRAQPAGGAQPPWTAKRSSPGPSRCWTRRRTSWTKRRACSRSSSA